MASRRGKLGAATISESPFDGSRNAYDTTREEWEEALRKDEKDLQAMRESLTILQRGGTVRNLTLGNAQNSIRNLEQVIQNKKKLISRMAVSLKSRRAMYWGAPDRVYRLTRMEQEKGCACCPKCKVDMVTDKFTKKDKLYICPDCGFKVPTSKTTTTRITLDVDKETGEVDVDVTTARRGK